MDNFATFQTGTFSAFRDSVDFEQTFAQKGDNADLSKYICYSVTHAALKGKLLNLSNECQEVKEEFSALNKEMRRAAIDFMDRGHTN